jgi:peptidyl-tRNA hydrolase, PTH1 family
MTKILLAGLGNIGLEYEHTRHNIGFLVIDKIVKTFKVNFELNKLGLLAKFNHKGKTFILLKPTTYMNLSGKSISFWIKKEKIELQNLLVLCDDIYFELGKLKVKAKGSNGGHNGLKSIQETLNTTHYSRIKIGIGNNFSAGNQAGYVLGTWSEKEKIVLEQIIEKSAQAALSFGLVGIDKTMNLFNK